MQSVKPLDETIVKTNCQLILNFKFCNVNMKSYNDGLNFCSPKIFTDPNFYLLQIFLSLRADK